MMKDSAVVEEFNKDIENHAFDETLEGCMDGETMIFYGGVITKFIFA